MFDSFLAGGLCGCLLTALAGYYFARRLKKNQQTRLTAHKTCTRAYYPPTRVAYAVHVRHIFPTPLPDLTEHEKTNLAFLRYLIEKGMVSEEV